MECDKSGGGGELMTSGVEIYISRCDSGLLSLSSICSSFHLLIFDFLAGSSLVYDAAVVRRRVSCLVNLAVDF